MGKNCRKKMNINDYLITDQYPSCFHNPFTLSCHKHSDKINVWIKWKV